MSRGNGPDFALCGLFSGKNGQSAARWLKKVEWELEKHADNGIIDPLRFLQSVDLLLEDDAMVWAETTPGIIELLEHPSPNTDTVTQFKGLFTQRYPSKVPEASVVHFDSEIVDLRQQDNEALLAYYQRTAGLLSRVGGRDCPREITSSTSALSPLEAAMLDTVMRAFTRGVKDSDICRDALRGLVSPDRSLYGVYCILEESRRAKGEYAHLQEEAAKAQELQFYREVVQRNMPSTQINSLRASFHAQYMPQWGYPSQPAFQQAVSWSAPTYQSAPPCYAPQSFPPVTAPYAPQLFQQPPSAPAPAPYRPPDAFSAPSASSALFAPFAPPAAQVPLPSAPSVPPAITPAPAPEPAPVPYRPQAVPLLAASLSVPAPLALFVFSAPSVTLAPSVPPAPAITPAPSALPPVVSVRSITYGFTGLGVSNVVSSVKSTHVSNEMSNIELNKCVYVDTPTSPPALPTSLLRSSKTATIALLAGSQKFNKEEEEPG